MEEWEGGSIPTLRNYSLPAALDLSCCADLLYLQQAGAILPCAAQPLIAVACLAAEHGLQYLHCMGLVAPWHVESS